MTREGILTVAAASQGKGAAPQRRIAAAVHRHPPPATKDDPEEIVAGYLFLIGLAAVLTLTCPTSTGSSSRSSSTILWDDSSGSWNVRYLVESVVVLSSIVWSFFALHGSDPGYLTPGTMATLEGGIHGSILITPPPPDGVNDNHPQAQPLPFATIEGPLSRRTVTKSELQQPAAADAAAAGGGRPPWRHRRRPWCILCHVAPPLRSHHCRVCQRCVATFDHHCAFVGTCLGECNRARFYRLLAAQAVGLTRSWSVLHHEDGGCPKSWIVVVDSVQRFWHHRAEWQWIPRGQDWNWILLLRVWIAKVYVYSLTVAALVLFAFHTIMAVTNSTTFEWGNSKHLAYLNGIKAHQLPFHQGSIVENMRVYGCFGFLRPEEAWQPKLWRPPSQQQQQEVFATKRRSRWCRGWWRTHAANGDHDLHVD
jgi:hypothetical protein